MIITVADFATVDKGKVDYTNLEFTSAKFRRLTY